MTYKRYTDEEIIKRLERCVKRGNRNHDTDIVLDLINRQKAEIEKLKSKYGKLCEYAEKKEFELAEINADISWFRETKFSRLAPAIKEIKVEACKEFAEKLKEKRWDAECRVGYVQVVDVGDIDEVLKEMVGEEE